MPSLTSTSWTLRAWTPPLVHKPFTDPLGKHLARSMNSHEPSSPYPYQPTLWAAIVAASAFTLVSILHVWFFLHGRAWFFWAVPVGVLRTSFSFPRFPKRPVQ
jgi:hypothetical protein